MPERIQGTLYCLEVPSGNDFCTTYQKMYYMYVCILCMYTFYIIMNYVYVFTLSIVLYNLMAITDAMYGVVRY